MERNIYVGSPKGLFTFRKKAGEWIPELNFKGNAVFALGKQDDRIFAAPFTEWTGQSLYFSDDNGRKWTATKDPLAFPEKADTSLAKIWSIKADSTGKLFFGVEPSALFSSEDGGETWELCEGLWNHPHRSQWGPGFGGLCLHTILHLSRSNWVIATSTGGCYRTEDAGETWHASNKGIVAPFMPKGEQEPEFGQCVHKISYHESNPEQLFLQHHWGVYRSRDHGKSWTNIGKDKGLPSDFGFGCVTNQPDTAFVIPIHSDEFRVFQDGKMQVFRTEDAGESWTALNKGLPQKDAYDCVLRDSFYADGENLAFGTTAGSLFYSFDNGNSWEEIGSNLPRITCVRIF